MKTKEQLIQEHLEAPYKIGEYVLIKGRGIQNKDSFGNGANILRIGDGGIYVEPQYGYNIKEEFILDGDYKKYTRNVGYNPINEKPWNSTLRTVNFSLGCILHACGFDKHQRENKEEYQEINWNPTIKNNKGEDIIYQRDFCWTLEQNRLLIESVYNNINVGMIIIKKNSYESVEEKINNGTIGYFKDVVDGKQRLKALLGFVNNEFSDSQGIYWRDFSDYAQSRFLDFSSLSYGEIGEDATDKDVKDVFLGVNFTGVPMSEEHINFVKEIQI